MTRICLSALFALWLAALAVETLPREDVATADLQVPSFDIAPPSAPDWLASAAPEPATQVLASHGP